MTFAPPATTSNKQGSLAHGSWRRVTGRIVVGAVCALTASSLLMPSISLAAEWIDVDGNQYNAGTAAGDDAGTWKWDGADDMQLNGYNGGQISAGGKLNVTYNGNNTVTSNTGRGIEARNSKNEDAELNIQGNASSTLNVNSKNEAIYSSEDINISGEGTINATSATDDGIEANGGNLTIKGNGTVTGTGASDGIRADGNITIDSSGKVVAKATNDQGLDVGDNLTIKGGGQVTASSEKDQAISCGGNIDISGGSRVEANAENEVAVFANGSAKMTNATFTATGVGYGIYAYKGITFDHATVTARASAHADEAIAIYSDEDDIIIKNGSLVDALAAGENSSAINSFNYQPGKGGGHIYISDSVVKAIARYAKGDSNTPNPYDDGQNPTNPGLNIGIFAVTSGGVKPATISITRSKVTAEGDTAAIFAVVTSKDGKEMGAIKIKDANILTPVGGKIVNYYATETWDNGNGNTTTTHDSGQTIGTGDATISDINDPSVAKSAVIASPETPATDTKPEAKPQTAKTTKAAATTKTKGATLAIGNAGLAATGDASLVSAIAGAFAGLAALGTGIITRRKRS